MQFVKFYPTAVTICCVQSWEQMAQNTLFIRTDINMYIHMYICIYMQNIHTYILNW